MDRDIATRVATSFDSFDELVRICRAGYTPTIWPARKVPARDDLGRYSGHEFELDSQVREFLRRELAAENCIVWPA